MEETTKTTVSLEDAQAERKPYSTPTLTDFGSVAEVTQGAAGTGSDSAIYS